jgi:hypothetical protein
MRVSTLGLVAAVVWCGTVATAAAQEAGLLALEFLPTGRAQLAIWVERADGTFMTTVRLTEGVAYRGIGNRPGASQMNSGFRWPYGRREGVLPVWATRRAQAPGAQRFRRVIFQDRTAEGLASRTSSDSTADDYYCLSFMTEKSSKEALDAVSCASVFSSDKGRFITQADVDAGYAEPYEPSSSAPYMRALSLDSLYPPRHDVTPCVEAPNASCDDHPDSLAFNAHVHEVMPDIDAVTMATPVGDVAQSITFTVPADWTPGNYRACIEINVEGDYNENFNPQGYPTPKQPADGWDSYAYTYGYPYRGQPSVIYCADFPVGSPGDQATSTSEPAGSSGPWDVESPEYGQLRSMAGMSDDPTAAPGSGADRLHRMDDGSRFRVTVRSGLSCADDLPPSGIRGLVIEKHPNKLHAHEWVRLAFEAASDDRKVARYDVRVSTQPILDDASFDAAVPAKQATIEAAELLVPTGQAAGEPIRVELGGLVAQTEYFVAVRAVDACNGAGPIGVQEVQTPAREFTTVSPCFVATAAYGDPLATRVGTLRRLRDRHLSSNRLGRALVTAYHAFGPELADLIRDNESLRAVARAALAPAVRVAESLEERNIVPHSAHRSP